MADFLEGDYRAMIGGDNADNRASTASVVANHDGSILERLEGISQQSRVNVSSTAVLTTGTTIFTVAGGFIKILELFSVCNTLCDATAATLKWTADGSATNQTATDFTGASGSLANFAANGIVYCNFAALSTAPVITGTTGVTLSSVVTTGILVPPGVITTTVGSGPTTGTFTHYMRWQALGSSVTVS